MLKIVVDATPVSSQPSGVGFYVASLIQSLSRLEENENFQLGIVYQPRLERWLKGDLSFPPLIQYCSQKHLFPLPVRISNLLLAISFKPSLSYFEKYLGSPNILHGTNYNVYPCYESLRVMNIYDLAFIKYPNYVDSVVKTYTERIKKYLQWTDLIITISESSKKDIIEYLRVKPEKVYITPLASRYTPDCLSAKMIQFLVDQTNYDFSQPYLLFVSTIEPRKNINTIIKAFNRLKEKYKIDHNLVLIGSKGWNYQSIFAAINNSPWKSQIYHFGYLSSEIVALFYMKADIFLYPSYYEGFGLPVLEAMTLGAPVITSNTSSIPEVTGNAAILIDPNNYMQLVEAILGIISDSQMRQELIDRGKERAKLFSWERTAKETLNAYRNIYK